MNYRISMASFGSECPRNWEEIAAWLNDYIDEQLANAPEAFDIRGELTSDGNELLQRIWERYCAGEIEGAPAAEEENTNEKTLRDRVAELLSIYTPEELSCHVDELNSDVQNMAGGEFYIADILHDDYTVDDARVDIANMTADNDGEAPDCDADDLLEGFSWIVASSLAWEARDEWADDVFEYVREKYHIELRRR